MDPCGVDPDHTIKKKKADPDPAGKNSQDSDPPPCNRYVHLFVGGEFDPLLELDAELLLCQPECAHSPFLRSIKVVLGDPELTANVYYKSRNLPNTGKQNYSTDLR